MSIELREKLPKDMPKNLKLLHNHSHPQVDQLDEWYARVVIGHIEYKKAKELSE